MKSILVTGGAGFIGSHLCEYLIKDGHDVVSLDNYFTGTFSNHIDGVRYINGSTKNIDTLINFSPDIIYHLGEYSRVEQSFHDIDLIYDYNIQGTQKVLEFVRKNNCKLVYAGSSTKFGDGGLTRNTSPYAYSKAANTELIVNYGNWFNISYAIVYFYNVYGPREISSGKYATLIGLYKEKFKNNEPLTVVSPGTQERNFTHIDDIISGLTLVGEKGNGDEFGIGSNESFSILSVAEMFGGNITMVPNNPGNRMGSTIVTKKTEDLGWAPTHRLKDYINDIVRGKNVR